MTAPTEREIDEVAVELFERRWGDEKVWRGRRTNRAYYRRIARAELTRRANHVSAQ